MPCCWKEPEETINMSIGIKIKMVFLTYKSSNCIFNEMVDIHKLTVNN